MSIQYNRMRPDEIKAARNKLAAAYIGLGILEWHGEHNVVGLDGEKADALAKHFAKEFGGVVFPPLFWGDNRSQICELVFTSKKIPGIEFDHTEVICDKIGYIKNDLVDCAERCENNGGWNLWIQLMIHIFFQIESFGFKYIVPIPGHYPLFGPLNEAIRNYKEQGGKSIIFVIKDTMYADDGKSGDHAAAFETSLMMELMPETVDMSKLEPDVSKPNIGVRGLDPRIHASREFGRQIIKKFDALLEADLNRNGSI